MLDGMSMKTVKTDARSRVCIPGGADRLYALEEHGDGSITLTPARVVTEAQHEYDTSPELQQLLRDAAASRTVGYDSARVVPLLRAVKDADTDLYAALRDACELIVSQPQEARKLSTAFQTEGGTVFRLAVVGFAPWKVFWTLGERRADRPWPRIEAIFEHSS